MQAETVLALYYLATASAAGTTVCLLVAIGVHLAKMFGGNDHG